MQKQCWGFPGLSCRLCTEPGADGWRITRQLLVWALPGICRHRASHFTHACEAHCSPLFSQPSWTVLIQSNSLQCPSTNNKSTVFATPVHHTTQHWAVPFVNLSFKQLTHLNAPSYLNCYHHPIIASPSSIWSLRNSHFPSVFREHRASCAYRYKDRL